MLRGILQILHTPFEENGDIDWASFARQVEFSLRNGTHGLVIPANASEFYTLNESERLLVVERAAEAISGSVPLVVGVQAQTASAAVRYAEHAAKNGATAVMAMPPLMRAATPDVIREYYRMIADVGLDVIIQNAPGPIGTPQPSSALASLLASHSRIAYVKEEVPPILHRISAVRDLAGASCEGVFGGANGLIIVEELDRGGCGNMPAGGLIDVQVKVFDAYESGNRDEAIRLQSLIFPLLFHASTHGAVFHKYLLWRRGVLSCPAVRDPQAIYLDAEDRRTIADRFGRIGDILDQASPFVSEGSAV